MHPDLHTDLDNLDSVENNLRHSAKGSLDAYDVTFSSHHKRKQKNDPMNNNSWMSEVKIYKEWKDKEESFAKFGSTFSGPKSQTCHLSVLHQTFPTGCLKLGRNHVNCFTATHNMGLGVTSLHIHTTYSRAPTVGSMV